MQYVVINERKYLILKCERYDLYGVFII
jgi:hypothetical protein